MSALCNDSVKKDCPFDPLGRTTTTQPPLTYECFLISIEYNRDGNVIKRVMLLLLVNASMLVLCIIVQIRVAPDTPSLAPELLRAVSVVALQLNKATHSHAGQQKMVICVV